MFSLANITFLDIFKFSALEAIFRERATDRMSARFRRQRIFPKQISDIGAFVFVVTMIPSTYVFEAQVVVPELYRGSPVRFYAHLVVGTVVKKERSLL